jgi:hypothetical protein
VGWVRRLDWLIEDWIRSSLAGGRVGMYLIE